MNQRDLATRNFNRTNSRVPYGERLRRRRRNKTILLALLAVIIIILIIALVFIIRDIADKAGENRPQKGNSTEAPAGSQTSPREDPAAHPSDFAVDADGSTYMLSESRQEPGAWLMLDLGAEQPLASVELLSDHPEYYIRSADVEYSSDGSSWTTLGEITGTPSNSTPASFPLPAGKSARYVRVILTSGASKPWAVNTFRCVNPFGSSIQVPPQNVSSGVKKSELPPTGTSEIKAGYDNKVMSYQDIYKGFLVLVNQSHSYVFPDSEANILSLYEYRTTFNPGSVHSVQLGDSTTVLLDATALKALNSMCDDFYKATGITSLYVGPNNGYRSKETQEKLYAADPVNAARPGTSDHSTGYAVNIDIFDKGIKYSLDDPKNSSAQAALAWVAGNAHKYGFIQRYPEGKDPITGGVSFDRYHYRYVGYPHAYYMTANGLCLEEYLEMLEKNHSFSQSHLIFRGDDGNTYEIYYVPGGSAMEQSVNVPVPSKQPYTVSGTNCSGFVVTVTR